MSNRTDIVVETDNAEGQVLLSASRVYDLTEDKTQDTINSEVGSSLTSLGNTLNQLDAEKADESSLAYRRSGATNTGAQIATGTYFYLDGTLKRAIATIAQNASFTAQNCVTVTAGGLNELSSVSSEAVSFVANNYYSELTAFKVTRSNKVIEIRGSITCDQAYTASPGIAVASFPAPKTPMHVVFYPSFGVEGKTIRCFNDGSLYVRYGEANKSYDIHIVYIAE